MNVQQETLIPHHCSLLCSSSSGARDTYHRNSNERVAPIETSLVNKAQKMVLNILWGCIFEKTASLLEPIVVLY